jgi:hypothetical protein
LLRSRPQSRNSRPKRKDVTFILANIQGASADVGYDDDRTSKIGLPIISAGELPPARVGLDPSTFWTCMRDESLPTWMAGIEVSWPLVVVAWKELMSVALRFDTEPKTAVVWGSVREEPKVSLLHARPAARRYIIK